LPVNARKIALYILEDVEQGGYFNLVLKKRLKGLEEQDKRFISALCFTTLENLLRIDHIINYFTQGKRVHRFVRSVLRLGICQLLFFESVPASAAVNECVKLVEQSKKRQLKGFVNAVLRAVAENVGGVPYPSREAQPAEYLSVLYSYPLWLTGKYIREYGFDFAEEMLSCRKQSADTCIRPNRLRISPEQLQNRLAGAGCAFYKGDYAPDAYYIKNISAVEEMPLYQKGLIAVQGEASMLVVEAAGIDRGERVLDVCAAPGGKTAYAAQFSPSLLVARDLHPHRVELMRSAFSRLGVEAEAGVGDAAVPVPAWYGAFDCVLLDVPCSALGLLYRKPDIKASKRPEEVEQLAELQREILETCSRYVRPGGRLVYSTCTINRRENEQNVADFLNRHPEFSFGRLADALPERLIPRVREGQIQLFPHIDHIDGFYIALLQRGERT